MTSAAENSESLSIGIVAFNNARLIEQTVQSVLSGLPAGLQSRVVILDNHSADDTPDIIRRLAETDQRIDVMFSDRNMGFGAGHNRILEHVDTIYHVICNPDITLTGQSLDPLLKFLQKNPDVAIACPRVHFRDGRLQPLNRLNPTVLDLFLRRFLPGVLRPLFRTRMERYEMRDVGYDHSYPVPFVSGAFMACRTLALREINGFDERYFLYFEDADLSRTVQARGWRTAYCPESVVIHDWQREAHKNIRGTLFFSCSAIRYFNKWGWKLF